MNATLHAAIVNALASALAPAQVYSQVPQDATMPYVLVAEASGDQWDTSDSDGGRVAIEVTVISGYLGTREALVLADAIRSTLGHGEGLDLEGAATLVDLWTSQPSTDILDDGRTTRAMVRVTVLLDDIAPTTA